MKVLLVLVISCLNFVSFGQETLTIQQIISSYENINEKYKSDLPWQELNEETQIARQKEYQNILEQIAQIKKSDLAVSDQINTQMLTLILENEVANTTFDIDKMPLNAEGGFLTGVLYNVRSFRVTDPESFEKYKEKLVTLPTHFDQRIEWMKAGIKDGKQSPKLIVNNCIDLVKAWTKTSFTESSFYKNTFDDNQKKTIEIIYHSEIIPAYHKMHDFLKDEYLKTAPKEIGISTVKEGKEYYEALTRYYSTYEITPQEVFDTGMSEVKRIKSEMNAIIKRLGFEGDFAQFLEFLRTDSQFYPTSAVHLLSRASIISKNIEGELPNYFGRLTPVPFTVKPVPAAIAPTYTAGRYSQGSFHNHKAGEYWVNTTKLKSRPFYTLPALTLHEAVPGHHLQIMLADELEGLPDFRKTYLSAFGEGWALYGEYLGKEMGIYRDDYEDFGRLTYEMWRACRLVVDPGMHYFGWSRDKAVDFMSSNTALSLHEVNTEIDRYIGWPGQAISYKLGEIKIRELRKKTENELGDKFDIRAFHDLILENGSIPLEALEIVVNAYIAEVNNPSAQTTSKFIHNVYFWMKEGVDLAQLEKDLIELGTINAIEFYSWGKPAKTAKRPIIEDSYDYAINAIFNSLVDYEAYKVHPTHVKFLEKYSQSFTKVTIFDNKIEPKK